MDNKNQNGAFSSLLDLTCYELLALTLYQLNWLESEEVNSSSTSSTGIPAVDDASSAVATWSSVRA